MHTYRCKDHCNPESTDAPIIMYPNGHAIECGEALFFNGCNCVRLRLPVQLAEMVGNALHWFTDQVAMRTFVSELLSRIANVDFRTRPGCPYAECAGTGQIVLFTSIQPCRCHGGISDDPQDGP